MSKKLIEDQIKFIFQPLNNTSASNSFPSTGKLRDTLNTAIDKSTSDTSFFLTQSQAAYFATASVEMWHRALHSYLISLSLTEASPLWSSVAGYYSSHYSIRAFAHLFGNFQLYKKHKKNISLELNGTRAKCVISNKGSKGEHRFYWEKVHSHFPSDTFFPDNNEFSPVSDSSHRNKINYLDHFNRFPVFHLLTDEVLRSRSKKISLIEKETAPIPDSDSGRFPEIENVQIVAYYRMYEFKNFVDDAIGASSNRFWKVNRNPAWCSEYIKFEELKSDSTIEKTKDFISNNCDQQFFNLFPFLFATYIPYHRNF